MSITNQLYNNEDLLRNTNVYPTPIFPTSAHENMLTTLLRKKVAPEVDEWINGAKLIMENETKNKLDNQQVEIDILKSINGYNGVLPKFKIYVMNFNFMDFIQ